MTYIPLSVTERNWKEPCWATPRLYNVTKTIWPSSRLYNVGLQKFGFHQLKYHLIICVCMWVYNVQTGKEIDANTKKRENLLVLLPYLSYFSLLFLAFVNDVRLSFNSFFLHTVCDLFVLAVGSGCLLRYLFFYSIVDIVIPERKMIYKKKHMHIYSLYIWSMSVFMFRLNCSTFKLNSRNEWGNSKSGKCW